MAKDSRNVYFYDIHSRVRTRRYKDGELNPFPQALLAKALHDRFNANTAEVIKKKSKQSIHISDMRLYPDRAEILIGYCDTTAADPTLVDRPKKKRRIVNKIDDEGLEHSAHVIWHFGSKSSSDPCPFYLEGAVGLGSTSIVRFVNTLLRSVSKHSSIFEIDDPEGTVTASGAFKKIKTWPRIELTGHPSKEFVRDLKKGTLTEVEIYTESDRLKPWDANSYAVEQRRAVVIRPNEKKVVPNAWKLLTGVFSKKVTDEFEYARVSFKTENSVARSARVFSSNLNLVNDDRYVRKEIITFEGTNLPNSFEKFHGPIIKSIRKLAGI
mgnify:CR=1 FL=1